MPMLPSPIRRRGLHVREGDCDMKEHVVVYKCADPWYDFNFPPAFARSNRFTPECRWLSHDGSTWGRGWGPLRVDAGKGTVSGKDFNRRCKFSPQAYLPECPASIYVDGNVEITAQASIEVDAFLASGADIGLMLHAEGRTIPEEIAACRENGKLSASASDLAERRFSQYVAEGLPEKAPIYYAGILMRRHRVPRLDAAMRDWASEYADGVTRDQISLPFVLWRNHIRIHHILGSYSDRKGVFVAHRHKTGRLLSDVNEWRKRRLR